MIKKKYLPFLVFFIVRVNSIYCNDYKPSTYIFPPFWATLGFHKATQTHVSLLLKGVRIRSLEGISVVKLKAQDDPKTESDDDELTGYTVDSTYNILGYNPTFTSAAIFKPKHANQYYLNQPHGIDATPEGDVFIADTGNRRMIILFNNNGNMHFVESFTGFEKPYDVSHDKHRNLYITDNERNTIEIYTKNGKRIKTIKHRSIKQPTGIEVIDSKDIWHHYKNSFIIIINKNGKEILKFTLKGELLKALDISKIIKKPINLRYVTADYYSQILITDSKNHTIHKLDRNLNYITAFGRHGVSDYEFIEPNGIDIWRRYGQLFVTERTGGQYYWIGVDILNVKISIKKPLINVHFLQTEPAFLDINLYRKKKLIKNLVKNQLSFKYNGQFTFNLFHKGHLLPPGEYTMRLEAVPTYSSKKIFKKKIEKKFSIK